MHIFKNLALAGTRFYLKITCYLAPKWTTKKLLRIFLTPPRHPTPETELQVLGQAQNHSIIHRNRRLNITQWGQAGKIVLVVHGWGGRGSQFHTFIKSLTEVGLRVVAFDGPAHGTCSATQTDMLELTETLMQVADAVGPIHSIIAHSLGGSCAVLATTRGLKVQKLVLIGTPKDAISASEYFGRLIGLPKQMQDMRDLLVEQHQHAFKWEDLSSVRMLAKLKLPTLIVHDTQDKEVPHKDGLALSQASPTCQLLSTTGLGHRRILNANRVVTHCLEFINNTGAINAMKSAPYETPRDAGTPAISIGML